VAIEVASRITTLVKIARKQGENLQTRE